MSSSITAAAESTACGYSRMKPWRAALTSATASGKSTRIASRSATACSSTPPCAWICESAADGQLDGGVERQRRELLALRLLHGLGLLLRELAQAAHEVLGVAPERKSEAASFHRSQASGPLYRRSTWPPAPRPRARPAASPTAKGDGPVLAERLLEPPRRRAEPVEVRRRRESRLRLDRLDERLRREPPPPRSPRAPRSRGSRRAGRRAPAGRRRPRSPPRPRRGPRARPRRARRDGPRPACPASSSASQRARRPTRRRRGSTRPASSGSAASMPVTPLPGRREALRGGADPLEVVAQRHGVIVDSVS